MFISIILQWHCITNHVFIKRYLARMLAKQEYSWSELHSDQETSSRHSSAEFLFLSGLLPPGSCSLCRSGENFVRTCASCLIVYFLWPALEDFSCCSENMSVLPSFRTVMVTFFGVRVCRALSDGRIPWKGTAAEICACRPMEGCIFSDWGSHFGLVWPVVHLRPGRWHCSVTCPLPPLTDPALFLSERLPPPLTIFFEVGPCCWNHDITVDNKRPGAI
jgi:hypothetical protein